MYDDLIIQSRIFSFDPLVFLYLYPSYPLPPPSPLVPPVPKAPPAREVVPYTPSKNFIKISNGLTFIFMTLFLMEIGKEEKEKDDELHT